VLKFVVKVDAGREVNGFRNVATGDEPLHLRRAYAKAQRISFDA
jgi:hypothetical protein